MYKFSSHGAKYATWFQKYLNRVQKKFKIFEIHTKWVLELTISSVETFKRVSNFTENMMAVYSLYM